MLEIAILKVDRIGSDPDTCEFKNTQPADFMFVT